MGGDCGPVCSAAGGRREEEESKDGCADGGLDDEALESGTRTWTGARVSDRESRRWGGYGLSVWRETDLPWRLVLLLLQRRPDSDVVGE